MLEFNVVLRLWTLTFVCLLLQLGLQTLWPASRQQAEAENQQASTPSYIAMWMRDVHSRHVQQITSTIRREKTQSRSQSSTWPKWICFLCYYSETNWRTPGTGWTTSGARSQFHDDNTVCKQSWEANAPTRCVQHPTKAVISRLVSVVDNY